MNFFFKDGNFYIRTCITLNLRNATAGGIFYFIASRNEDEIITIQKIKERFNLSTKKIYDALIYLNDWDLLKTDLNQLLKNKNLPIELRNDDGYLKKLDVCHCYYCEKEKSEVK